MTATYCASNGCYYREADLWYHYETGAWEFYCGDAEAGKEVVRTEAGELLTLVRVDRIVTPFDPPGRELLN